MVTTMRVSAVLALLLLLTLPGESAAAPEGQMTWAVHVSIAPTWFDPGGTPGIITPFLLLPALHDALVKPMPGTPMAPSLAESWSASRDGLTYEFVLRKGVKFHNGDPLTAEDVKFSFERYTGAGVKLFRERVQAVELVDPHRIRFRLKTAWPDFMTFVSTSASGIAWIVPKKYLEQVGDEGFKKAPVGAGPYRFVSFKPGVELVLEAFEGYWRKPPSVKRLLLRVVPDESTRLAMVKTGEADISYSIRGVLAEEVRRTPGLSLKAGFAPFTLWIGFAEHMDPKSPFHDRRLRQAVNLAINRQAINQAETLGLSKLSASMIPQGFDFYWPAPPVPYDPKKTRELLAEAGFPGGLDGGELFADLSYASVAEAVANDLSAVGIRVRLRALERAAFFKQYGEKKLKNLILGGSAASGNAATRIESFVASGGTYGYGSYPEIDDLFRQQAVEPDRKKRETLLHRIQQIMHERVMFVPVLEPAFLNAVGPRVEESGLGLIQNHPYSAPYEDLKLKR